MQWQLQKFEDLSGKEVHEILAVRQEVFVVEQECVYLDADNLDYSSYHLTGRTEEGEICGYARINFPGSRYAEPSIGRLLIRKKFRSQGLAKKVLEMTVAKCFEQYPESNIKISAQLYLKKFYTEIGFAAIGLPYDEDGIEHINMILERKK